MKQKFYIKVDVSRYIPTIRIPYMDTGVIDQPKILKNSKITIWEEIQIPKQKLNNRNEIFRDRNNEVNYILDPFNFPKFEKKQLSDIIEQNISKYTVYHLCNRRISNKIVEDRKYEIMNIGSILTAGLNYYHIYGLDRILKMIYYKQKNVFKEVVGANIMIVNNIPQIIMITNRKGEIVGVGGKKDYKESDIEAMIREIKEELSIKDGIKSYDKVDTFFYIPLSDIRYNISNKNGAVSLEFEISKIFSVNVYVISLDTKNRGINSVREVIENNGVIKENTIELGEIRVIRIPYYTDYNKKKKILLYTIYSLIKPLELSLYSDYGRVSPSTLYQILGLFNSYTHAEHNEINSTAVCRDKIGLLSITPESIEAVVMQENSNNLYKIKFL